ncbi:hypothetical protein FS837_011275 [Tulasnella sp. UAMH 9824]|nr:hypothetical protein FS837_011275 [Tulasnella sp. UAMH 9824]
MTTTTTAARPSMAVSEFDPLREAMGPPPNETQPQKEARERQELDAKKISDGIDALIQREKQEIANRRAKGRTLQRQFSTCLSEFSWPSPIVTDAAPAHVLFLPVIAFLLLWVALMHAPETFDTERAAWRLVVFLNVVRSVQRILKVLELSLERDPDKGDDEDEDPTSPYYSPSKNRLPQQQQRLQPPREAPLSPTLPGSTALGPNGRPKSAKSVASYVAEMKLRLSPVTSLEETIINKLVGPEERNIQLSAVHSKTRVQGSSGLTGVLEGTDKEFFVRPDNSWSKKDGSKNGAFINKIRRAVQVRTGSSSNSNSRRSVEGRASMDSDNASLAISPDWDDKNDPGRFFHMCGPDLIGLWEDPWCLVSRFGGGHEADGSLLGQLNDGHSFLNDLDRITAPRYMPTDDDILRARIKTIGVSEHIFPVDKSGVEWRLYDVGGARTQRHAWIPYFDSVDCILFLAPLSPFDQALPEDRKVNCLEDSLIIWKELCTNKLLENVPLVLFLNKSDLLRKKLEDGVQVSRFVVSYGNRTNDYETAEKYFRSKFEAIRRQYSNNERPVFTHITSCINQVTTADIINHVQDLLMRENLKNSSLM